MTIEEKDIDNLIDAWKKRADNPLQTPEYKLAVNECLYDLLTLVLDNV